MREIKLFLAGSIILIMHGNAIYTGCIQSGNNANIRSRSRSPVNDVELFKENVRKRKANAEYQRKNREEYQKRQQWWKSRGYSGKYI
jgi:hypothetical protein